MSNKVVVRKVEILVPENAPFDVQVIGAAILGAVTPLTGHPAMVTINPDVSSTSIVLPTGYERFPMSEVGMLAQPADQHQGEPVAWRFQTHAGGRWYLTHFEASARAYEGNGEGGAVQALAPLTPADPGEVERLRNCLRTEIEAGDSWKREAEDLRAQLAEMTKSYESLGAVYAGTQKGFERLQAQLAERDVLRTFANEIISAAYEGGSFEGGDIQDMAVRHGLLRVESRAEECGEACACREYGFPAECYRKTGLLSTSAEPSAATVSDEALDRIEKALAENPLSDNVAAQALLARPKPWAEPSAPDETWSLTEEFEGISYDSLSELIQDNSGDDRLDEEVRVGVGCTVHRAEKCYPDPATFIDAERVRLEIESHMDDNASANGFAEVSDGYPTVSNAAQDELEEFLEAWARKHLAPPFYNIRNQREHTITAEDLEAAQ